MDGDRELCKEKPNEVTSRILGKLCAVIHRRIAFFLQMSFYNTEKRIMPHSIRSKGYWSAEIFCIEDGSCPMLGEIIFKGSGTNAQIWQKNENGSDTYLRRIWKAAAPSLRNKFLRAAALQQSSEDKARICLSFHYAKFKTSCLHQKVPISIQHPNTRPISQISIL